MFDTLKINNLRGIRSAEIKGLTQVNLFFGKNNCGKSTVLEALFLISGQSNPVLPLTVNALRNYKKFAEADLNIEFHNLNPNNPITVSVAGTPDRWLEITRIKSNSRTVKLGEVATGSSEIASQTYGYKLTYTVGEGDMEYTSEIILKEGDIDMGKMTVDKRYKEILSSEYIPSNLQQNNLNEEFARIIANKEEAYILESLREIDGNIRDVQLVGDEILVDIGVSQRLPVNMMGDGLRKLLSIILSIYRCRKGVLLIDEIDNGFHFSTMKVLWKVILKTCIQNGVQLFASTHNIDSIKGLKAVLAEADKEEYRDMVSAFKLIRDKVGDVLSLRYDYESFQYSVDQELEMR